MRVNLVGAANVAHAFAPAMAEARSGTLLFIASVAGQIGSQTDPPYSASKAGLINFAQCAAKDLAPVGRAGQHALPRDGQDDPEPRGLRELGGPAARRRADRPTTTGPTTRSRSSSRSAAGRSRKTSRRWPSSSRRPGEERHRADDQRRRRVRDALVSAGSIENRGRGHGPERQGGGRHGGGLGDRRGDRPALRRGGGEGRRGGRRPGACRRRSPALPADRLRCVVGDVAMEETADALHARGASTPSAGST